MSDVLEKLWAGKREMRRKLAALPFAQKLEMVKKMRDRSLLIASNPLRQRGNKPTRHEPVKV